jgi:hypothetical protein
MPFNPRKYLTEEQINEIIDPVTLGVAGAAALAGGAAGYFLKKRGADKAAKKAAEDAYEYAEFQRNQGVLQGRGEGYHQGRESVGKEEFLQKARDRIGLRSFAARHYFADPKLVKDTHDHARKFETGWNTVLSGSHAFALRGYVENPHTFHAAVDRIELDKDQRTNDDIAKESAARAGGRTENYLTKGHEGLVKHIRIVARREGAQGLDELAKSLVHHKHHGDANVMAMARVLLGHVGNRTDEIFAERTKGHEFNTRTPVSYHPDLPHPTNSTGEAETLRHKILRDLFAGTYKPEERVIDAETSGGGYIDHPKYGNILDITSISRDRRAFEVDRAAVQRAEGRNIGELTPVQEFWGRPNLHGKSVGSPEGKEAIRHITSQAKQRADEKKKRDAWEAEQRKIAAGRQAEAQRKAAAEEAARQAPISPPAAPISPPAAPITPPAAPVAPPQEGKGGRRGRPPKPKAEGGEAQPKKRGRGRPKKVNEDYLPPWFKVF